jgi:hypothetical protein
MSRKKLFLSTIIFFVLVILPFIDSVGASLEMWSRTYGGASSDSAKALVQTGDGGYAIAGYTTSFGAGSYDFWLVKIDANGNMEWNRTYGGTGDDIAYALVETSDGGYALTGSGLFVKTDAYGNMEWNQAHGGSSLVETSDGGYAYSTAGISPQLVKTDAKGNIQWKRTYEREGFHFLNSLVQTSDGGYALAGKIGFIMTSFWLLKTDEYGNMEWENSYGEYGTSGASSLVETSDGGFALAGTTNPFPSQGRDFFLVKTDANGNMEWNRKYGGTEWDAASSLVKTSDGGYALVGTTNAYTTDNSDFWLVKTDADGTMEWNSTYGGASNEFAYSLVETSDGGYALAGETSSFGAGDSDFWLVKTDAQGIPEFPSWFILPLLLIATVVVILYRNKLKKVS